MMNMFPRAFSSGDGGAVLENSGLMTIEDCMGAMKKL
jgi:hypothetical protein